MTTALVTLGKIYLPTMIRDGPLITHVGEVRPSLRVTSPPTVGPATPPTIVGAEPMMPQIVDTEGPQQQTGADEPSIVGAENLVPRITKAEEE